MQRDFRGQIRVVGPGRGGLSERKKNNININGAMSTYVRLVDQTIRYTTPRIIPSFYRGEIKKKKRDSDRAVRPCSFLLDVIFLGFFFYIKAFSLSRFGLGRCAPATSWQSRLMGKPPPAATVWGVRGCCPVANSKGLKFDAELFGC